MKLKKFALRGMIILGVVIALCVLFSGTLRSLTTAKVKPTEVKKGKFEDIVELQATVAFPEKEEIKIKVPDGLSLTVQRVPVAAGQQVKKGDVLVYTVLADMDKELSTLEKKYDDARSAIEDWDRKHGDIRLTRNEEAWVNAYDTARNADKDELKLRQSLMAVLDLTDVEDLTLENVKKIVRSMNVSQKVGQPILDDYKKWIELKDELAKANEKLKSLDRYAVSDDVWATLKTKRDAQDSLKDAEEQMMQLRKIEKQLAQIKAPHDGYVVDVKVKKGDPLMGETEILQMTTEGKKPVLRADLDPKKPVQKGAVATVPIKNAWSRVETKIVAVGVSDEGKQYADADINDEVTNALGNVSSIMKKGEVKLKITTRAKEATTLVKKAAVRSGSKGGRCVYVAAQTDSALGGVHLVIAERAVTVLAENEEWVSIQEDLNNETVVYMEDRYIQPGDSVIMYSK